MNNYCCNKALLYVDVNIVHHNSPLVTLLSTNHHQTNNFQEFTTTLDPYNVAETTKQLHPDTRPRDDLTYNIMPFPNYPVSMMNVITTHSNITRDMLRNNLIDKC